MEEIFQVLLLFVATQRSCGSEMVRVVSSI
jgi:hypothetical protein